MQRNCCLAALVALTLLVPVPGIAQGTAKPDPLLTGTPGPCDPKLDGPDYIAGTDVDGNPVAPADLPHAKVPVPSGIMVPLRGQTATAGAGSPQAYAELSQKDADSILNPKPACTPDHRAR